MNKQLLFAYRLTLSRLKRTGVISVQNPVEKAMQEGRIQELDDDDDAAEDLD
jgi:hypothetical protein